MDATNKPNANVAIVTQAARAKSSQCPRRVVADIGARVLIPHHNSGCASAKRYDNRYEQVFLELRHSVQTSASCELSPAFAGMTCATVAVCPPSPTAPSSKDWCQLAREQCTRSIPEVHG